MIYWREKGKQGKDGNYCVGVRKKIKKRRIRSNENRNNRAELLTAKIWCNLRNQKKRKRERGGKRLDKRKQVIQLKKRGD